VELTRQEEKALIELDAAVKGAVEPVDFYRPVRHVIAESDLCPAFAAITRWVELKLSVNALRESVQDIESLIEPMGKETG
jgi:hypothetical protein